MQRVKWLIKVRQAIIAMFLASVAALMISTAPAYADETADAATGASASENAAIVEEASTSAADTNIYVAAVQALEGEDAAEEAEVTADAEAAEAAADADATAADTTTLDEQAESAAETLTNAETTAPVATSAEQGAYVITESGEYTLEGEGTTAVVVKGEGVVAVINAINASIDATGTGNSALSIVEGARAVLNIIGTCVFTGDVNQAGIQVASDAQLEINGTDEPSSLTAIGNAGVDYSTTAEGKAAGYTNGAGIGGTAASPDSGSIVINGNDRNLTVSAIGGGKGASGIGSSYAGPSSSIVINDANLIGVHGGCQDAAIEGSVEYAKSTLEGGAAIGGGTKGTAGGDVVISNCYGRDIVGGGKSAGIGGGCWANVTNVFITGSDLEVEGGTTGAAIGSGRATNNTQLSVDIQDSTIVVRGGTYGAGIGLGINGSNYLLGLNDISIANSQVTAYGGAGAAGIGAGVRGYNVNVSITDGSTVVAYAGENYVAKYTERYNLDGVGQSGAAAIGRGAWGSVQNAGKEAASLSISADSSVLALSSGDNWAIAGFTNTSDVAASVLEMRFSRNYDLAGNDFVTRTVDEDAYAETGKVVCFLDGVQQTILKVRDAETGAVLYTIDTTQLGDDFANGYAGSGRVGYYSFALTVADGTYKLSTTSDVRSLDALGDELLSEGDEGYLNGATHLNADEVERQELFEASTGVNAYDKVAFRVVADPEPEPAVPVDPDPDPEPSPDPDPDPDPEPTPDPTPTPDDPAPTPVTPDDATISDGTPTTISDGATPLATPAVVAFTPVAPLVAEAIADDATPLAAAAAEAIADEENPLAAFDHDHGEDCWVHWWILLGMVLTTIYSSVVVGRRKRHSHKLHTIDKDVMNGNLGTDEAQAPSSAPTQAPQPAMTSSK